MIGALRVVIADDEKAARDKLVRLLKDYPDVEVVGHASNGQEAVEAVRSLRPDLLLLDIRMPVADGFAVAQAIGAAQAPKIVFVTAFDQYAVRAFEVRAFDYLLKPFDAQRLGGVLAHVRQQRDVEPRPDSAALRALLEQLREESASEGTVVPFTGGYLRRVCIRSPGRSQFVRLAEVEWIEAWGNYVRLHTGTARPLLRESLRHLLDRLDPAQFIRVHRSALVNMNYVREMRPCVSGDYLLTLDSGTTVRLSRLYRAEADRRLGRR